MWFDSFLIEQIVQGVLDQDIREYSYWVLVDRSCCMQAQQCLTTALQVQPTIRDLAKLQRRCWAQQNTVLSRMTIGCGYVWLTPRTEQTFDFYFDPEPSNEDRYGTYRYSTRSLTVKQFIKKYNRYFHLPHDHIKHNLVEILAEYWRLQYLQRRNTFLCNARTALEQQARKAKRQCRDQVLWHRWVVQTGRRARRNLPPMPPPSRLGLLVYLNS